MAARPNGEASLTKWGKNPIGFITYTQDGHMAAQIMRDPPPKVGDPDHPTPEESEALLDSYLAYGGTYDFDPGMKTVTHHVQLSIYPSDIGENAIRKVEFDGDRVTLTPTETYAIGGEEVFVKLTWRKLR